MDRDGVVEQHLGTRDLRYKHPFVHRAIRSAAHQIRTAMCPAGGVTYAGPGPNRLSQVTSSRCRYGTLCPVLSCTENHNMPRCRHEGRCDLAAVGRCKLFHLRSEWAQETRRRVNKIAKATGTRPGARERESGEEKARVKEERGERVREDRGRERERTDDRERGRNWERAEKRKRERSSEDDARAPPQDKRDRISPEEGPPPGHKFELTMAQADSIFALEDEGERADVMPKVPYRPPPKGLSKTQRRKQVHQKREAVRVINLLMGSNISQFDRVLPEIGDSRMRNADVIAEAAKRLINTRGNSALGEGAGADRDTTPADTGRMARGRGRLETRYASAKRGRGGAVDRGAGTRGGGAGTRGGGAGPVVAFEAVGVPAGRRAEEIAARLEEVGALRRGTVPPPSVTMTPGGRRGMVALVRLPRVHAEAIWRSTRGKLCATADWTDLVWHESMGEVRSATGGADWTDLVWLRAWGR